MAVPNNKWYRLGKKTLLFFLIKGSKIYLPFLFLWVYLSYKIKFGNLNSVFYNFFEKRYDSWYISGDFALIILWLCVLSWGFVIFLVARVLYRQYKFMLDDHAFHVKRGLFFIKEIVIPYSHIQNVEIKQPVLFRIFGLAELDITTLGNNNNVIEDVKKHKAKTNLLPVIDKRMAKVLAHELILRGSHKQDPYMTEYEEDVV
jgi:uncharacterized membrane protein YdbT with pleckstrin-like domain